MKKLLKDKKGSSAFIFFFLVFVIALMLYMYHTNTTFLILERSRIYEMADEAANKAAWEIYQYQSQPLNSTGQIDANLLQIASDKAINFFKSKGYTLQNASAHIEGNYLVITGNVVTKYKEPVLPGKRQVLVRSGYYTNNYVPQTGYNQSVNVYGTGLWGNNIKNWTDNNAKWIWGVENVGAYWFKKDFSLQQAQTITVNATADNVFTLYIDGKQILSGSDWQTKYSVTVQLPAGTHEVKAYVINLGENGQLASSFEVNGVPDNPGGFIASITDPNGSVILHTDETWQLSSDGQNWQDVGMIAPKNMPIKYYSPQWVDTSHYELQDVQPGNNYVIFSVEGRAALKKINK